MEVTYHKDAGDALNQGLTIEAMDDPGPGGAHHTYRLTWTDRNGALHACDLPFQLGGVNEMRGDLAGGPTNGLNGLSNEALLAVVMHRLLSFQNGSFPSTLNDIAIGGIKTALGALHDRSRERISRGVEGQHKL